MELDAICSVDLAQVECYLKLGSSPLVQYLIIFGQKSSPVFDLIRVNYFFLL